jgi:LPPG:FO 2-phospho-L-lactate transferase
LHLFRRELQSQGLSLSQLCAVIAQRFSLTARLLPMCDEPAPTTVLTSEGEMAFQHYFVKHQCRPVVSGFRFGGAASGGLTPPIRASFADPYLEGIVLCPSNPYLSIAPILAVPGMRDALKNVHVPVMAISPIIGGAAVKGPAAKIMRELDLPVSPLQIAREYSDFIDLMLIDAEDGHLLKERTDADPVLVGAPIMMRSLEDRRALAQLCLDILRQASEDSA